MSELTKESLQVREVILSTRENSYKISRGVNAGRLKKIAPRLYSSRVDEPADWTIKRNLWDVLGLLFPETVISQRSAFELKPDPEGGVYLTGRSTRITKLPGVTVRVIAGHGPVDGDLRYGKSLWIASQARAYLENLTPSRKRGGASRVLPREEIEDRLERLLRISGETSLNRLRDQAKDVAPLLGMEDELAKLQEIISKLLGSRTGTLTGIAAAARLAGLPYDADRLALFDSLVAELRSWPVVERRTRAPQGPVFENEAFFDAYFSNYIEGNEFEITEAIAIVFENQIPSHRPKDAHDVLGTHRLLSDPKEMSHSVTEEGDDLEAFLGVLQRRHHTILANRPEVDPGEFKTLPNHAGNTAFVDPQLVRGTLHRGLERFRALETPFARAAFMMFLVSEVHPFTDGNGRLARVMMNAELLASNQQRVIIPSVYREDYLSALRALSRTGRTRPLAEMLDRAQLFASRIDFGDLDNARMQLMNANAFADPKDAKLLIPSALGEQQVP